MKISLYLSLLSVVLIFKIVSANQRLQYCGSRLADVLSTLCHGQYNEKSKRNQLDSDMWDYKELEDYNEIYYPFRSKRDAMSFITYKQPTSKNNKIIEECCIKPCDMSEIKSYCQNSN
ncbi:LIRP-like [Adelges cooleyi]|uniref:LIRP-like n=1 Tax=Adelges cooleyi TaxID=133065 RepID=UPI00218013D8|nr:LIRP-like [Adelges cooleyi]